MSGFGNRGPQDAAIVSPFSGGQQLFDPTIAAGGGGHSYAGAITATAGGTRGAAVRLAASINRISVCATAGDSVALPPATGGQWLAAFNAGAAACQIYADSAGRDTINGVAAGTGVSLASGKAAWFCSAAPGAWFWVLSA